MTSRLQRAINIATNPIENAMLILNDEQGLKERSIYYINSRGERRIDYLGIKLSKADFEIFMAVACRCRCEFEKLIK